MGQADVPISGAEGIDESNVPIPKEIISRIVSRVVIRLKSKRIEVFLLPLNWQDDSPGFLNLDEQTTNSISNVDNDKLNLFKQYVNDYRIVQKACSALASDDVAVALIPPTPTWPYQRADLF